MYTHVNGVRHEVDVGGVFSYGYRKFYPSKEASRDAAAHMALYRLVTHGKRPVHGQPCSDDWRRANPDDGEWPRDEGNRDGGPPVQMRGAAVQCGTPASLQDGLQRVLDNPAVRALEEMTRSIATQEQANLSPSDAERALCKTAAQTLKGKKAGSNPSQQRPPPHPVKNANLVPLAKPRLQDAGFQPTPPPSSKWKFTDEQLRCMIETKLTPTAKLQGERERATLAFPYRHLLELPSLPQRSVNQKNMPWFD